MENSRKGEFVPTKCVIMIINILQLFIYYLYEGCLQSLWTDLITPSWNFVEVWWWQVMHFVQHSTHLSKTCCRSLITSKFLFLELPFHVWKSPEISWGEIWTVSDGVPPIHFFQAGHRIQFRSHPMLFLGFYNHEKGAPRQEVSKWPMVCSMFSRRGWSVVRSASCGKEGTRKRDHHHTSTEFWLGVIKSVHQLC
jgi:hypothetical protein